jgi:hypothetical protein
MDQVILLINVCYVKTLAVPETMLLRNIKNQMEISHVLPHARLTNLLTPPRSNARQYPVNLVKNFQLMENVELNAQNSSKRMYHPDLANALP